MRIRKSMDLWRCGLMFALLCIMNFPNLAGAAPLAQIPTGPLDAYNGIPDYYTTPNWANSPPLAKFVNTLAPLGCDIPNNIGQCIPIAVPDTTTFPGSDYYIIQVREYFEKMHSDLNPTKLRGYVQLKADGTDQAPPHSLGPIIVTTKDRPVRVKFVNGLPTGAGGNLFIPVDESVMGAGEGPIPGEKFTQNRANIHLHGGRTPWISDGTPHQWITPAGEDTPYVQGVSMQNVPDMCFDSSGNAIPRATDPDCLTGSSNPGPGASTYYFTNQQSTRLMFYHDHSFGITRLNVYVGGAAGYVITDPVEQDLIDRGIIPGTKTGGARSMGGMIPLIIQDKTFVNADVTTHPSGGGKVMTIRETDPLWNWGSKAAVGGVVPPTTGDLWMPHVYMPAQLPEGSSTGGVNPYGRWMYGPWFYPATAVTHGPVANPYYDPNCGSPDPFVFATCQTPGQPQLIPGTPNVSMGMEAFQDSAVVNGTVFPTLTVDPKPYRFRILNAASDRFQNLSFYVADSTPANVSPDARLSAAGRSNRTEVKMVTASAELAAANNWPADWPIDGRDGGVPDPGVCQSGGVNCPNLGPDFLQIGTEGGFLPAPTVRAPQPVTYITDPTAFWVGVVDKTGLALGPAERADVIVDFSAYAGKTLILYNDAPAAWPARVPGYDYFTGAPDMRDSGGYGTGGTFNSMTGAWEGGTGPLPGYAPNTRTVMQVIVNAGSPQPLNTTAVEKEFTSAAPVTALNPAPVKTLFERAQEPIIVGQAAYRSAYPNSYFPSNFPWEGVTQMNDEFLQFVTLAGQKVKIPTEPKGIHDEMGASFDPEYGRMSGNLAMQLPNATTLNANLILYGFSDIPTEIVSNSTTLNVQVLPNAVAGLPGTVADGTQIWKISHNGVDTHPIHFHIFDVQLINRVGWDGQIAMPEANELGWKEMIKISPLMDTIVAVRPRAPALPFGLTNSLRPLNPAIPIDSAMGFASPTPGSDWPFFSNIDWVTGEAYVFNPGPPAFPYDNYKGVVTNVLHNFGWEYVWHCHILSHEEMDMMRPIVLKVDTTLPPAFAASAVPDGGKITVTWNDPTPINYVNLLTYGNPANEVGFNVYRSTNGVDFTKLNVLNLPANSTRFADTSPVTDGIYKVEAFNAKGSTFTSAVSSIAVTVAVRNLPLGTAPATVELGATVGGLPAGITVSSVAFYDGDTLLGSDTTSPYRYNWNNVMGGVYSVTAKVTDSRGVVTTSAPLGVLVTGNITADFSISGSASGADIGFCENVTLNSNTSTGAGINGWSWSTGGDLSTEAFLPSLPGTYPVTLTVNNSGTGETASVTKNVVIVNHNPTAIPGGPYAVVPGGSVTLAGSGTDTQDACNTTPLTYAWNVDNVGNYDYFTANPTISYNTLLAVLGVGTHTMTFKVTDSNGGVGTGTATLTVYAVSLVSSPASHQIPGTPVTFTAAAAGGTGSYEYQFQLKTGTTWNVVQNFGASNVWNWNTAAVVPGTYEIQVDSRSVGSTTISSNKVSFVIDDPLTLTPSLASPQIPGTQVAFTALAGGLGNFEYQFWLRQSTGAWKTVQNFGANANWNWNTATAAPGTYWIQVGARVVGTTTIIYKQLSYDIATPPVATSVTLAPSPASPQLKGTPVMFTGAAAGGSGFYEYRYQLKTGANWATVQNFSSNAVWNWNTTAVAPGTYSIQLDARSLGSATTVSTAVDYVIVDPLTLTSSLASPQFPGTPVSFTALAGGPGNFEYQFWLRPPTGTWKIVQPYSTNATWNSNTAIATPGTYWVQVGARVVGTTSIIYKQLSYVIATPPVATSVSLAPTPASPQLLKTPVSFTAAAAGGSGYYEYRFQLKTGTTWATVQNFSSKAVWNWNTTTVAPGTYSIQVDARSLGSATTVSNAVDYVMVEPLAVTPSVASPQFPGTPVSFTALAGGPGNFEYQFWLRPATGTWKIVQPFSTNATWNSNTAIATPGTYWVQVGARVVGTTTTIYKQVSYVITAPPIATSVTLTPAPASPRLQGIPVAFTGAAAGGSGNYEYRFLLKTGTTWATVQNFSSNATWNWDTTTIVPGTYSIQVDARSVGTSSTVSSVVNYVINIPFTLTPSPASPQVQGTPVSFTALTGAPGKYEYQFWLRPLTGNWQTVQNFSPNATWNWDTAAAVPGSYWIQVAVRVVGTTATNYKQISFVIN